MLSDFQREEEPPQATWLTVGQLGYPDHAVLMVNSTNRVLSYLGDEVSGRHDWVEEDGGFVILSSRLTELCARAGVERAAQDESTEIAGACHGNGIRSAA